MAVYVYSYCNECELIFCGERCPRCRPLSSDAVQPQDIAALHARFDALRDAIDSASRRTDTNSDEIDRQDIELCDLSTHLAELHEAHNALVAYAERIEREAGEMLYVAMDKYQALQQRIDRMGQQLSAEREARRMFEARLADSEDRQIAMQKKLDEMRTFIARRNLRYDVSQ